MKITQILSTLALGVVVLGCAPDQKLFGPSLMPRAEAAQAISGGGHREDALRGVALDAIRDGDAVVANEAIDAMKDVRLRDDVAGRCSEWLARHWRAGEATGIAKKINDVKLRDQVLEEIALGRP